MKTTEELTNSIERYRQAFWARHSTDRPPIAVSTTRNWMPMLHLRAPLVQEYLRPADITAALTRTEYEDLELSRPTTTGDWLPYAAIWRGVPWLEAICGCPIRVAEGALAPEPFVGSAQELGEVQVPVSSAWLTRYEGRTRELADEASDCWISPTIMRGSSDVLNAMRGTGFFLDLHDDPTAVRQAAERVNDLLIDLLLRHFCMVAPRMGGYGNFYGYWSPGPTVVIQEDALGLCSPKIYREIFAELNSKAVQQLGQHIFFHLHTTGFGHYRDVLTIPDLAGLELTVEQNGPSLAVLEPVLREVLERVRLILYVDAYFEELAGVLRRLPAEGLYIIVAERFISDERALAELLSSVYPKSGGH